MSNLEIICREWDSLDEQVKNALVQLLRSIQPNRFILHGQVRQPAPGEIALTYKEGGYFHVLNEQPFAVIRVGKDGKQICLYDDVLVNQLDKLYKENEELTSKITGLGATLSNLLAVIHGDGGHYETEHGREAAVNEAIEIIHRLRDERS